MFYYKNDTCSRFIKFKQQQGEYELKINSTSRQTLYRVPSQTPLLEMMTKHFFLCIFIEASKID